LVRKNLVLFFILVSFAVNAQTVVKSLRVSTSGGARVLPVYVKNIESPAKIKIEFDVASKDMPNMDIIFRFCDKNWVPYETFDFENSSFNTDYNLDFSSLSVGIEGANYHFRGTYPSQEVQFPFSGKYIFEIVDTYDKSIVYDYGKFYVVEDLITLAAELNNSRIQGRNSFPAKIDEVYEISCSFDLPDGYFPGQVERVEIVENKLIEFPYIIQKDNYNKYRYYEWNGTDQFKFIAMDVAPGNEYRQIDIRNSAKFPAGGTKARFGDFDQSRFYSKGSRDLNGDFELLRETNADADYIDVTFELQTTGKVSGDVFLTGSFNFWELWPIYRMTPVDGFYKLTIPLKRGVYDYAYVIGDLEENKVINADRYTLEGNFWETINEYSIFLYYRTTELGGYDKLVGYTKIISGEK